jgi:hypothetical protein
MRPGLVRKATPRVLNLWCYKYFAPTEQVIGSLANVAEPLSGCRPHRA